MIRARFTVPGDDYRPVVWPITHPYWCSGESDEGFIIVAYADDEAEIYQLWPDALDIKSKPCTEYKFTSRFPRPDWFSI